MTKTIIDKYTNLMIFILGAVNLVNKKHVSM